MSIHSKISTKVAKEFHFHEPADFRVLPDYRHRFKRMFDIVLSVLLLPTILPLIVILAIAVKRDGGAAFFGHRRVGKGGQTFRCWKIRTMVSDSRERLEALLESDPDARAEWEAERKLTNDPRITRLGSFLRKSSLDELPQIWNVLLGEMSFVGPRPVPQDELEANYGSSARIYKQVRPGITGLWQVSGRNDISYDERVEMDINYNKNLSFKLDLVILLKTVTAVLGNTGK